jgi:hypothetical protein
MKFFRKKAVWVPTFPGLLVLVVLFVLLFLTLASGLYPFLVLNNRLPDATVMIVEGWMNDDELADALFLADSNTLFVASGIPIEYGALMLQVETSAHLTAARLEAAGIPAQRILIAPAQRTQRDRTYMSALAVREKLKEAGLSGTPANLISVGVHSRRSFFLYRRAFGPDAPLGVVALECRSYDQRHWLRSSMGFKAVVTELISWTYTQCTRWKYR